MQTRAPSLATLAQSIARNGGWFSLSGYERFLRQSRIVAKRLGMSRTDAVRAAYVASRTVDIDAAPILEGPHRVL